MAFPYGSKSDVATIFPAFFQQMAKQFTNSVKIIQSDGGGEFVNTVLQTHFAANGIIHRLSCPGTPEQNGLAKRRHRHIVETSLTLLAHASVPVKYWTAAFNTAVFLINHLPSSVLDHMSPHELAFGSSPKYDFLRVFGCSCYPLLSPFGRTKLEYKSICCVFLGYLANHKGYCCLEPHSGRLYISRHVRFNEQHFPFKNVTASHSSRS
jgi:histone deacetylase 1/2